MTVVVLIVTVIATLYLPDVIRWSTRMVSVALPRTMRPRPTATTRLPRVIRMLTVPLTVAPRLIVIVQRILWLRGCWHETAALVPEAFWLPGEPGPGGIVAPHAGGPMAAVARHAAKHGSMRAWAGFPKLTPPHRQSCQLAIRLRKR